jgi:hypothetical protein
LLIVDFSIVDVIVTYVDTVNVASISAVVVVVVVHLIPFYFCPNVKGEGR